MNVITPLGTVTLGANGSIALDQILDEFAELLKKYQANDLLKELEKLNKKYVQS